jgi:hypothetical protein
VRQPQRRERKGSCSNGSSCPVLGRQGRRLFAGDDDVFAWVAAAAGSASASFRNTSHPPDCGDRLQQSYLVQLIHDHTFSQHHGKARGHPAAPHRSVPLLRLLLHGLRNGAFSCDASGPPRAARIARRFIDEERLNHSGSRAFAHRRRD